MKSHRYQWDISWRHNGYDSTREFYGYECTWGAYETSEDCAWKLIELNIKLLM